MVPEATNDGTRVAGGGPGSYQLRRRKVAEMGGFQFDYFLPASFGAVAAFASSAVAAAGPPFSSARRR